MVHDVTFRLPERQVGNADIEIAVREDGDLLGTLGVSKEAPVGFKEIRLQFKLDTDATQEQLESLLKLTKRYCVVFQTLQQPPVLACTVERNHRS